MGEVLAICAKCGKPLDEVDLRHAYREVTGWVEPRPKGTGGVHALSLRRETGALMHNGCMLQQKLGPVPERTLFDDLGADYVPAR